MTDSVQIRDRIKELRRVPAASLIDDPRNWRTHPNAQRDALRGVLSEIGIADALLVRENGDGRYVIVDGHLRKSILDGQDVPVLVLDVDEAEAGKMLLTLDPLAAMATVDKDHLDVLLRTFDTGDAAVQQMLEDLAKENGLIVPPVDAPEAQMDRAEELRVKWGVESGQLWQIGRHRLLCGDSTKTEDVTRVMGWERAILMATDPPYGVELDTAWREEAGVSTMGPQSAKGITWDSNLDWSAAFALAACDVAYVWHAGAFAAESADALRRSGYEIRQQIIWVKTVAALSRSYYHWKHEPCWFAVRKGVTTPWYAGHDEVTVWEAASPRHIMGGSTEDKQPHPTQKPIELFLRPMRNHLRNGEIAFDPFLGSGTTMVAAEQLGRVCYGLEIAPKYGAVCLQRLADMGLEPRLLG